MNIFKNLFKRSQPAKQVAQETEAYVEGKKQEFKKNMDSLVQVSKKSSQKAVQTHNQAVKLNNDVTKMLAQATGGFSR